jgi:hypothetical protein
LGGVFLNFIGHVYFNGYMIDVNEYRGFSKLVLLNCQAQLPKPRCPNRPDAQMPRCPNRI